MPGRKRVTAEAGAGARAGADSCEWDVDISGERLGLALTLFDFARAKVTTRGGLDTLQP